MVSTCRDLLVTVSRRIRSPGVPVEQAAAVGEPGRALAFAGELLIAPAGEGVEDDAGYPPELPLGFSLELCRQFLEIAR